MAGRPRTLDPDQIIAQARGRAWIRSVCQARFRKEEWLITLDQFNEIWHDPEQWAKRGRGIGCPTMIRIDDTQPWTVENVAIVGRLEQLQIARARAISRGTRYGRKKKVRDI